MEQANPPPSRSLVGLAEALRTFNAERDWAQFHSPKNLAMALAAEAGEVLEPLLWLTTEQSREPGDARLDNLRDEIGDVLICLVNLANALHIDPLEAAFQKLEKNAAKFPVDQVRGKSTR